MAKVFHSTKFDISKLSLHPLYTGKEDKHSYAIRYPNGEQWFVQTPELRITFQPSCDKVWTICVDSNPALEKLFLSFESFIKNFIQSQNLFGQDVDIDQILHSKISDKDYITFNLLPNTRCFDWDKKKVDMANVERGAHIRFIFKLNYIQANTTYNSIKYDIDIEQIRLSKKQTYSFVETFME